MAGVLAIALGDVTGIGPEDAVKALQTELTADDAQYILVGSGDFLQQSGLPKDRRVEIHDPGIGLPKSLRIGDPAAANAAMGYLKAGAELCLKGKANALVTAPVNKEAII